MVSRIEPDRYADTGFAVKDTSPEINTMLFEAMMSKAPEERMLMGFDMMATARALVWSGVQSLATECERRKEFFRRYYGMECPIPELGEALVGRQEA